MRINAESSGKSMLAPNVARSLTGALASRSICYDGGLDESGVYIKDLPKAL